MTARSLKARVAKLENNRSAQNSNRVLTYDPARPGSKTAALSVGKSGKFMLVSNFATDEAWEAALFEQQQRLRRAPFSEK